MNILLKHNRKKIGLQVVILMLLTLSTIFVYRNVKTYEFIIYDDPQYITENIIVKEGLTLQHIAWAFTSSISCNWHPVTLLSHMLDVELFGLNAGYHHLMNLFIHICNTLLLYFLFCKSTGSINKSTVLAAFFALHPLHVESVAWVSERKDVLSAFFWLAAMLSYYRYTQRPSLKRYFLAFFYFILGALSKSMMVTFPFALLLFDYWPLNRQIHTGDMAAIDSRKNPWLWLAIEKIPMIAVSIIISWVALLTQSKGGAMLDIQHISIPMRIANALMAYIVYLKKIIWPGDLSVLYPLVTPPLWLSATGFVFIAALLALAFIWRLRHPFLLFGFLWYLGTLVPVIGIIQVGAQAMADRYTYIPSIGIFTAGIWGISAAFDGLRVDRVFKNTILAAMTATALFLMMLLSSQQVRYWQNSVTLMSNAVQVTKNNYVAHENLGLALIERGLYGQALYHFKQSVAINPKFANAYLNIGSCYMLRKDYENAIKSYQKAIAVKEDLAQAYDLIGKALKATGKQAESELYLKRARQLESAGKQPSN